MNTLYIECNMGVAGDMLLASLLELFPEPEKCVEALNALQIPGVAYKMEQSVKCGIVGTHVVVSINGQEEGTHEHHHHGEEHDEHEHHHHGEEHDVHENHHDTNLEEIKTIIQNLAVDETVKKDAISVYQSIAQAEGHVHNRPVEQIHFHEVGTMDAVADVVGVCYLLHALSVERIITSPIHVGSGQVHCAHGILPVPAPATAYLLQGIPMYSSEIRGELCTPTGAALVKYFSDAFGPMPVMTVSKIGYGMGKKDFLATNCVRVLLGKMEQ